MAEEGLWFVPWQSVAGLTVSEGLNREEAQTLSTWAFWGIVPSNAGDQGPPTFWKLKEAHWVISHSETLRSTGPGARTEAQKRDSIRARVLTTMLRRRGVGGHAPERRGLRVRQEKKVQGSGWGKGFDYGIK